ncbi:MAG TPA: ABC transporter ATP-binding protein [Chitinophagaceae bacterium]
MALLTVSGVSRQENGSFVVKDIHFVQQRFQKIAIAGETGSGKTTLLKMIAGLIQPTTGEIRLNDERVEGPLEKLLPGHPAIAYLSQHFELRNNYRVEEELESKNELTQQQADFIYSICRIDHLLKRKTDQLSGGERQRIVLARLLTTLPQLILLDEPFSNLDVVHTKIIKEVIHDIAEKLHISCIMIAHDPLDILPWADSILVMKGGKIIQQGTPWEIYKQPINEYCAGLFGDFNLIDTDNPVFANIQGVILNEKQILVRPEQFCIATADNYLVSGIVNDVLFYGSFYSINVLVAQQLIQVKTNYNPFNKGDTVYLSLLPGY